MMQACELCKCEYPTLQIFYFDSVFNKKNQEFEHMRVCNGCLNKLSTNKYKKTAYGEIVPDRSTI